MSSAIEATCIGGVVTADGVPVPGTTLITEGVGSSEGLLLIDRDRRFYVTSNAKDLKDILTQIDLILTQLVVVLTALDAVTITPGSNAASIASLSALQIQLSALKEVLR